MNEILIVCRVERIQSGLSGESFVVCRIVAVIIRGSMQSQAVPAQELSAAKPWKVEIIFLVGVPLLWGSLSLQTGIIDIPTSCG